MSYAVKEIFYSLQGEGAHAGRPAVFVRFAGCNLWSGLDADRARDAAAKAACAAWCDTDFVGGEKLEADEIAARCLASLEGARPGWLVATGGEPLLQLDAALVTALHAAGFSVAVETNGTRRADGLGLDWICVSPKQLDERWVQRDGDELKVVYPAYDPERARALAGAFAHFFVQPEDGARGLENAAAAVAWCRAHPEWRLSLQTHKLVGIR